MRFDRCLMANMPLKRRSERFVITQLAIFQTSPSYSQIHARIFNAQILRKVLNIEKKLAHTPEYKGYIESMCGNFTAKSVSSSWYPRKSEKVPIRSARQKSECPAPFPPVSANQTSIPS